jgi:cell division protein ZipA
MFESLFSFCFLLLLIGAAIVVVIYLGGRRKNNRNQRVRFEQRRPAFKPRRKGGTQATTQTAPHTYTINPATDDDDPDRSGDDDIVVTTDEPAFELPTITRSGDTDPARARRAQENQLELTFDEDMPTPSGDEVEPAIISLYVRPPDKHEFAGSAVVKAMNAVGLRYGDMKIFHHYGAGELRTEIPLFSVANMVEPGYFDLERVDNLSTPGLAMFLQLPGPLDGAVAFELFLNTAQRLAETLSADLYSAPKALLDGVTIDKMRRQATPFSNVH